MTQLQTLHINTERTWRGGEKQALLLMEGLLRDGHGVDLVCHPDTPMEARARASGVSVHPMPLRGELNPAPTLRIRKLMKREQYDVCHMHTSHAHSFGVFARGWRKRPITVVSRRVDFSIYRRGAFGMNWFKYRFGVDRYVAISRAIRDVLVRDGVPAANIEVVHSAVPPPPEPKLSPSALREQLGIPEAAPVLGNVAHLASHKGQIHLIAALPQLLQQIPELHLVIAGDGEERASLERTARELGVTERVHLPGFTDDVPAYLALFDAFCMPSVQEGLGTSLLDALHAQLPTIASEVGGIPEVIRHEETGLLVPPADPDALAAGIIRLFLEPQFARKLATRGHEVATQEFSVEQMVAGNVAVYRETIQKKNKQ
ncbi:MAG: glycosyltransferase [Planctomycetota bacterium]